VTQGRLGFLAQIKSYPATFWVANTMEIFERMAWYGFFAVSSLYITGPVETGGLGFTSEERGQIQAIVPFFLYLMPVLTGALADRYGYKKMFLIAYVGMVIFYYGLGQFKSFPGFLAAFMCVAVAAAIFKPVVVGTVARVTDASNSSTGFGIFYMMVNIGGFVGPIVAGVIRGMSWSYVFIACSAWAAVNLVIVLLFYKDPSTEAGSAGARTFKKVMENTVEVLGNLRFFITVFVPLIALLIANQEFAWFQWWPHCAVFVPAWVVLNFLWDRLLPKGSGRPGFQGGAPRNTLLKRMHCSNWRFALFLLIMSGFWTSFNQIFLTMPEYIRDYTDTKPMVNLGRGMFGSLGKPNWINGLAAIEETELLAEFDRLVRQSQGIESLVPDEPRDDERLAADLRDVRVRLVKLGQDPKLTQTDRAGAAAQLAALAEAERQNRAAKLRAVENAETFVTKIERGERAKALGTDPSLTDDDLATLASLVAQINAPAAETPLEVLDVVDAARKLLQYKVRIQATELGELLAAVPHTPQTVTDEQLADALKTLNKRLAQWRKPTVEGADAEAAKAALRELMETDGPLVPRDTLATLCAELSSEQRKLEPKELALPVNELAYKPLIWERADAGRQVNPEHIVNIDALSIVLLQVLISYLMARFHRFTTMIVGMVVAAVGVGLPAIAGGTMIGPLGGLLIVVIVGIVVFGIGEMMASPTSQEYVGRIAPADKKAVYMGYYFVSMALGNLFGGILSGQLYGKLARDMQRPDIMWLVFGGLMAATAVIFLLYNKLALPKEAAHELTPDSSA